MKRKDLFHCLRACLRLLLLLIPQLATDSGERFPQISFHTLRVAERRIEDRLHLTSTTCVIERVTTLGPLALQEVFRDSLSCSGSTTYREYLSSTIARLPSNDSVM